MTDEIINAEPKKVKLTAHQLGRLLLAQEDLPVSMEGCDCCQDAAGVVKSHEDIVIFHTTVEGDGNGPSVFDPAYVSLYKKD